MPGLGTINPAHGAPSKLPRFWFRYFHHFIGKGFHGDFRWKQNDHLEGMTIATMFKGTVPEPVGSLSEAKRITADVDVKFKPDMDPTKHVFGFWKAKQPCISIDSFIIKNQGLEKAGDLSVGDRILTADGTFQSIERLERIEKSEQYRIRTMYGLPVQTDGDHPFLVNDIKWRPQSEIWSTNRWRFKELRPIWKRCRDLRVNDILLFPKLKIENRVNLGSRDFGQLVGVYLGDGNLFKAGRKDRDGIYKALYCRISFDTKHPELIEKYKSILAKLGIGNWERTHKANCRSLVFTSKLPFPKPKQIPMEYIFANKEFQDGLIEGLVDSDGYIESSGRKHFTNSNLSLLDGFALILQQRGIIAHFRWRQNWNFAHTKKEGMIGELSWGGRGNRKNYFDLDGYFGFRLVSINKADPKPLVNIVTSNHTLCSPFLTSSH